MRLSLTIKPTKLVAPTKQAVIKLATPERTMTTGGNSKGFTFTGYRSLSRYPYNNKIVVMNLHKVRKSVIQIKDKDGKTKSKVTSKNHWVAYVYTFDTDVLNEMGIKNITQGARNFTLSK